MLISPSILNCDFLNLKKELNKIKKASLIHLDIMDGVFVKNISFGPYISNIVNNYLNIPLDIHLMVNDPYEYIDKFIFKNTKFITIHYEAQKYKDCILHLKEKNIKVGLSIKPNTDINEVLPLLKDIDLLLVMSVEPGFGGQSFIDKTYERLQVIDNFRKENNLAFLIEVDGGINLEIAKKLKSYNCDSVVVGSYLFQSKNIKNTLKKFLQI